jgi:hypothetical protein
LFDALLDLFQDPYGRSGVRDMAWMLKQVQHDKPGGLQEQST